MHTISKSESTVIGTVLIVMNGTDVVVITPLSSTRFPETIEHVGAEEKTPLVMFALYVPVADLVTEEKTPLCDVIVQGEPLHALATFTRSILSAPTAPLVTDPTKTGAGSCWSIAKIFHSIAEPLAPPNTVVLAPTVLIWTFNVLAARLVTLYIPHRGICDLSPYLSSSAIVVVPSVNFANP